MVATRSDDPGSEVHTKVQRMAAVTVVLTIVSALLLLGAWPWVTIAVGAVAIAVAMMAQLMSTATSQRFVVIISAVAAGTVLLYELQHDL